MANFLIQLKDALGNKFFPKVRATDVSGADTTPTSGSTNLVTSNGVFEALAEHGLIYAWGHIQGQLANQTDLNTRLTGIDTSISAKQDALNIVTLTSTSTPISSEDMVKVNGDNCILKYGDVTFRKGKSFTTSGTSYICYTAIERSSGTSARPIIQMILIIATGSLAGYWSISSYNMPDVTIDSNNQYEINFDINGTVTTAPLVPEVSSSTKGKYLHSSTSTGAVEWADAGATLVTLTSTSTALTADQIAQVQLDDCIIRYNNMDYRRSETFTSGSVNSIVYDSIERTSLGRPIIHLIAIKLDTGVWEDGTWLVSNVTQDNYNQYQLTIEVNGSDVNIPLIPTKVNDRFLHTNSTTGELEWVQAQATLTSNSYVSVSGSAITNLAVDYKNTSAVSQGALKFVKCTQSEYDALSSYDSSTMYIIVG